MAYTVETKSGLRELLHFRQNPLDFVAEAGRRGIDIRCFRFGNRRFFQVNHPDLIRDVLVTHDWNFVKGEALHASRPVLGDGLLTSEGELHRRQRRLVQPAFHSERLTGYGATMVECAKATSDLWLDGAQIAIDREMMRLTLDIVGRTLFSADLRNDAAGVGASLTQALGLFLKLNHPVTRMISPLRKRMEDKGRRVRHEIEVVLRRVVEEHRSNPDSNDMLSMMMHFRDANTGYMSDELLLDESLTLFLAGHETTANALTWTWHLLGQHPHIERRLHAELDRVLTGQPPTPADLSLLVYTGCVFRESLRLYPPAWVIGRGAVTDYRLGDIEVPAGSTLLLSPYATHRDTRFWDRPEEFIPERWLEEPAGQRPKFAFYPFGAGSRVCIGEHFAMMEGILLLAVLAQRWKLHPVPGQRIEMWPQITLRPRYSIQMELEKRTTDGFAPSIPMACDPASESLATFI
jgi:cytochrome P450